MTTLTETKDRFAGTIADKSELNITNSSGRSVINLWAERMEEIITGIPEAVRARLVLFGDLAEKAEAELEPGKVVMFTDCQRNPRVYRTDRGTEVETVDVVARGYKVLTKTQYEKARSEIDSMSLSRNDLRFTEADRAKLSKDAPADDDLNNVLP